MRRRRIESTERVSLKLSDTPRSWLSSNMVWASCRADAIEVRKSALSADPVWWDRPFESGRGRESALHPHRFGEAYVARGRVFGHLRHAL